MDRDHVALTEAEWKIMLLLWEKSPWTMMELTRALAEDTGWSKHTVITMLKRLFSGRASLLVNDMVEQGELDDEELRELQSILDRAEKQKKNRKGEPNESC